MLDYMRREHADILAEIRNSKTFEGEVAEKTRAALEAFAKQFA
jgi:F-type H+-transporting ATPase subunit alpha